MHLRSCLAALSVSVLSICIPLAAMAAGPIHKWSTHYGGAGYQDIAEIALDPAGNLVLTGQIVQGSMDFGGGPLVAVGTDMFLAKLTNAGGHIWSKRFGDLGSPSGYAVAVSPSGNILTVGVFSGTVDFGGGPLVATDEDAFAAEFDSDGNYLWSAAFGDSAQQGAASAAFDSQENMVIAGWSYHGSIDLGGGSFIANDMDGWVAKYDANGAYVWSHHIGDANTNPLENHYQFITNVRVDPSDDVVISGAFDGTTDFGNGPETSNHQDMFLTRYHSNGSLVRNQTFASTSPFGLVNANAMAIDGAGNVIVGGLYNQSVDFGGGPILETADAPFLVSFDASGAHNWSRGFQRRQSDDPNIYWGDAQGIGVGVSADGQIAFTGQFEDSLNLGGDWLATGDNYSLAKSFIAKFDAGGAHIWSGAYGPWAHGVSATVGGDGDVYATGRIENGSVDLGGGTFTATHPPDSYLVRFGAGPLLPVLISRFDARPGDAGVTLRWEFWSDEEIERFTLLRSDGTAAPMAIAEIADVHARSFVDRSVEPGRSYRYQLAVYTKDGDVFRSPFATATGAMPGFALGENRPNPFNPQTTIPYQLAGTAKTQHVEMRIVDSAGRAVRTLVNEDQQAGSHTVDWNGHDDNGHAVASGVYFCVLKAGKDQLSRKIVLLK